MYKKKSSPKVLALCIAALTVSACETADYGPPPDLRAQFTADSLNLSEGSPVGRWPTSSYAPYDAFAPGGRQPTYTVVDGIPAVHFDGVDDFMSAGKPDDWTFLSDGTDWTVFIAFKPAAGEPDGKYALL